MSCGSLPLATRGIAHSTRGKNSIRLTFHLLRISHIRNSVRPTFLLFRIFHIPGWERRAIQFPRSNMSGSSNNAYPESIRSRQFRFPKQLDSSDTRDSSDPFPPTIKKQIPIILTTKSPELSLIFNARYARQDIPKSSQSA